MPTVFLCPFFNEYNDLNDLPNNGGSVEFYLTETTTPVPVYAEYTGVVPNTNPVVFDSQGYPINPIWLDIDNVYDAIVRDVDGNTVYQLNHIGLPPVAPVAPDNSLIVWIDTGSDATLVNKHFIIVGIWDTTFTAGRRIKIIHGEGSSTSYATVVDATYDSGSNTTLVNYLRDGSTTAINDAGRVYYSVLDSNHVAVPKINYYTDNTGTSDALVANIDPAVLNQSGAIVTIRTSETNATTSPTLNLNGQGALTIVTNDSGGSAVSIGSIPTFAEFLYDDNSGNFILMNPSVTSEDAKWAAFPIGYTQPFIQAIMGSTITTWLANHTDWAKLTNTQVADIEGRAMAVSSSTHAGGTQGGGDDAIVPYHTHTGTTAAHYHAGSTVSPHDHTINDPGHTHVYYGPVANPSTAFAGTGGAGAWLGNGTANGAGTGITINAASPALSIAAEAPALSIAYAGVSVTNGNIQRTQYFDWIYKKA